MILVKCLKWFIKPGYLQGVFWAMMINVFSAYNDVIIRLTKELHWIEVSFFRYFFGVLMVVPLMLKDKSLFKTQQVSNHVLRAILGSIGLTACCFSVMNMTFSENETIMFTQPFMFLILAYFFLQERVTWQRWVATAIGFGGLIKATQPGTDAFSWHAFVPMLAAFSFASLDLMAKKMIQKDRDLTLIFYFGLGSAICVVIPMFFVWQTPTIYQWIQLALLAAGGNLMQVCIYRAFSATDASGLMPFRYTSLIIASAAEFLFFQVVPKSEVLWGALIIIAAAMYITAYEYKRTPENSKEIDKKAA